MSEPGSTIGLVLDGKAATLLESILYQSGYNVVQCESTEKIGSLENTADVSAWLVGTGQEDFFSILIGREKFLLPADNPPDPQLEQDFSAWATSLVERLDAALQEVPASGGRAAGHFNDEVEAVWILAGSTGATPALQEFLNAFRRPPPVAFIFAQHYDPDRQEQLAELSLENSDFSLQLANARSSLAPARVVVVPPRSKIRLGAFGDLGSTRSSWGPRYNPDMNELLVMFAAAGLPSPGVIILSGMGGDGAEALDVLDASGCRIWAQCPETAICGSMPEAAIATGRVRRRGSPAQLGAALQALYPSRAAR